MPIKACFREGRAGYKYGDSGSCYTYEPGNEQSRMAAKRKAEEQMRAIHAQGYKEK